ncbi:hypothetical protein ABOM_002349 [Aspergillus bombycis]|uniref:P/Homo B domain-containing protein n=1 Tax=Aspergillus bombycis TaxID=109264 RepID=A0A1F8ABG7_9EURO|nr:hypothetical protein ABOM_002349 [Aspergillus bombycis]OGM49054.1 hypothetical protein ABOM_002349 [Aspergillus bombycis]
MRNFPELIVFGFTILNAVNARLQSRSYKTHDYFALHLRGQTSPAEIALKWGIQYTGPIGELSGHHVFSVPKDKHTGLEDTLLISHEDIQWVTKLRTGTSLQKRIPSQPLAQPSEAYLLGQPDPEAVQAQEQVASVLGISDPTFRYQWHLLNTVQLGNDLNVTGVWLEGVTGEGITTAIIDDGLDVDALDLRPNYYANGSYDFNDDVPEPRPRLRDDHHGTLCAAEIAAAKNDICGVGVAYNSRVSGIRMLSKDVDDVDQATAMNYDYQNNDIYSCSWGPEDDGRTMKAPGVLVQRAIVNGVQNGRGGKGSIFVFSAGNGGSQDDNCNFDGYTNSIYSITVGAIDRMGTHPRYSESCSAQLVVAYSSGSGDGIYTTDNGDRCTALHSGTSAAGPLAAGAIALALSVRPDLTWRDVQHLMVETAVPVHESDGTWQVGAGAGDKMFSHDWGYGKVDAYALVQKAYNWTLVKPQAWFHSPWQQVDVDIPEGHEGLASYYSITSDMIHKANIARLEHVTVTMNVKHTRRGDLSVELISPKGIVSHLSTPRMPDGHRAGYVDWEFMSVAHWGEGGIGTWKILVKDTNVNGHKGIFINWRLNLWGETADGSNQPLHPLPGESEVYDTEAATMTAAKHTLEAAADTSSVSPPSMTGTFDAETTATVVSPAISTSLGSRQRDLLIYVGILALIAFSSLAGLLVCNYSLWKRACSLKGKGRSDDFGSDIRSVENDMYPLADRQE